MTMPVEELKVLIAEDDLASRLMVTEVLRARNVAQIDSAFDGKQARDMIDTAQAAAKPYHIVFLDWKMPHIEGIEVLRHFRSQAQFMRTAFVMVTGSSLRAEVMEAVKIGATAYMVKPVTIAALDKKFGDVLEWLRQRQVLA